jgi:tetratricopeptide (TPR) repeat protein
MNRQRYVPALILLIAAAILAGCHGDPRVRKQKYLESGDRFSAEGSYKEASIQYLNALKVDEDFAVAHDHLAQAYEHLGEFNAAISELAHTVDLEPINYTARIDLGNLQFAAGRTDEAREQADAVAAAQPDNAAAHALLSAIAARLGQKDRALAEIHRALELDPDRAAYHENLALLLASDRSKSSSVDEELTKAIALDPKSVNARLLLAAFYARNNRLIEAEKISWEAVAADPASLAARTNVAQIILKQGDSARAEQVLRQASKDFARNPQGVRLLADYYVETGQLEKARSEFAALVQAHSTNEDLQKGFVNVLLQLKDFKTAQSVVAGLLKSNPNDPEVAALNGNILLSNGDATEAVNALQASAKTFPNDAPIQYWLGKAALAKGDTALAQASFLQTAELNPSSREIQQELASLAMQTGDMTLLANVAAHTVAAAPRIPDGYVWRAIAEMSHSAQDAAESDLKTAGSVDPKDALAYLQLGKIRFAQKRFAEGVGLLEQALAFDPNSVEAARLLVGYDLFQKQPGKALELLNAQIGKSPQNSGFYDLLTQLEIQDKKFDQASAAAEKAIHLNPSDGDAVRLFVQTAVLRGQTGDAIGTWEKWTVQHPDDAGALAILGTLEESRGDLDKAEADYKRSLEIQPQQPVAANNLAYRMLVSGKIENGETMDTALTLALLARQGMPDSPDAADTLAWAYYCKGIYPPARNLLEDALGVDPDSATMQYHLGMVYRKLGDKQKASIHLKKAMTLGQDTQTAREAREALQALG